MDKIGKLKKEISPLLRNINVELNNSVNENEIEIRYKTSEYPKAIYFFLNEKASMELKNLSLDINFPLIALDHINRAIRKEYYRLCNIYNNRSSIMFVRNKSLLTRYK